MNLSKLDMDLDYVEEMLSYMREHPYNDLWQNQLITNMLEVQYDILTTLIKSQHKPKEEVCSAFQPNYYNDGKDRCIGIKHPDFCTCGGDKDKCDFYK